VKWEDGKTYAAQPGESDGGGVIFFFVFSGADIRDFGAIKVAHATSQPANQASTSGIESMHMDH
jgi:hypothetical protein